MTQERLEKAKRLYEMANTDQRYVLESLFPELKESEDDSIRKELIKYFSKGKEYLSIIPYNKEECIAWLEKQGEIDKESYEIDEKEKREFVGDGFIKCYGNFQDFREGETYWLEYVGNDNYNVRSDNLLGKTYHITPCQLYTIFKKMTWLEKQGEQKHADKVEPKFKIGDWIVQKGLGTYKIVEICESWYEVISYKDGIQYSIGFDKENDCHLWTIQDAKDGDVLADSLGNVCIYQEPSTKLMYHSYCYGNHKCFIDMGGSHEIVGSYPATKEQYDLLFQKMKEAGYKWDAEKKELKKSQRMVSAEAKEAMYDKPAWSEEDEQHIRTIIRAIYGAGNITPIEGEFAEKWLKSLKDRVQPKQEWSEVDECYMAECINAIAIKDGWSFEEKRKTKHWLNSLKNRYTWKPSNEQLNNILDVLSFDNCTPKRRELLESLYEQLKKL